MILGITGLVMLLLLAGFLFMRHPMFGRLPEGARLERIKQSPNYKDGVFQNQSPTRMLISNKSKPRALWDFLFIRAKDLRPSGRLPAIKTDLKKLAPGEDVLIWMGHSSLYLQVNGKRIAIDPVLVAASPVPFVNKAFAGTNIYRPEDLPDPDYLILTHDHWDHLDYNTMLNLKNRTGKVICPLGVGAHLEYWGFDPATIIELDWNEHIRLNGGITLTALPARHFSGRGLSSNHSLWTGYMLQSALGNIYLSGDSGYDTHFKKIKAQFGTIDFAIMENGQYNEEWKYIHIMPEDLVKAIEELQPRRLMTIHHSKFALGRHSWYEPMQKIEQASREHSFNLITPMIGEPVMLKDSAQAFTKWWERG
ncbi:MAG: MBL fold metallo-hydrolase [Chitinophagaceae bacterium]|nr:MBL fold metallo-hydrolase [Chitinophagaceae bacterium]